MPKRKKCMVKKVGKVFTSGLLLSTLYSEASFSFENSLKTKNFSADIAAQLINILSHFFPSLHSILEEVLPKHIKDNQQLLNILTGIRKESSASSILPSLRGKYKNVQVSLQDVRFLSDSNSPILEPPTFAPLPFERRSQSINISLPQKEKFPYTLSTFYSPTRVLSILLESRPADFMPGDMKVVKQNITDTITADRDVKYKASSSAYVSVFAKPQMPELNRAENYQQEIICLLESSGSEGEKQLTRTTEPKIESEIDLSFVQNLNDSSQPFLENTKVEFAEELEIVGTSPKSTSWADALLPTHRPLLTSPLKPSPKKSRPKKTPSNHVRPKLNITSMLREEETVGAILRLSSHNGNIPTISSISERFSQAQLRDNKLPTSYAKVLEKALQEQKIKLSANSGMIVALQRVVKDQRLKISEVPTFMDKLSQQIDKLIVSIYKTTLEDFEKHILKLVQPRHHILTDIDFSQGFEKIAQAVLELWRAKILTEYIEKGSHEVQEKPLPTLNDLSPFVNQVIKERFEQGLNPELSSQLKENAKIVINPSVQNSPLYGSSGKFSTEQKKEILAQVFKLLVLDPSFSLPTFINSRENKDIDCDKLKSQIRPYIILAIGQLYGPSSALDIQINVLEEYVKTHCLYGGLSSFSEQERKDIFKSVLENPLFNLLTVINSGNSEFIKPFIVDSIEKLYGSNRVEGLELEVPQVNVATSASTTLSVEEIVKKAEPWLITKLFELLPGYSTEEKIDFLINIASQDQALSKIRTEIENCSEEDKLIQLQKQEEEVSKKTYARIMETILEELGSQNFTGSPLKLASAVYRDVKFLIEDYLNTGSGFVTTIERTEPTLKQSLQKATTSSAIYRSVRNIVRKGRYKIQTRIDNKRYIETSPLEVPKFVFLFSLPYWVVLKERWIKREKLSKQLEEKAQQKRKFLLEKLNTLFFKGSIQTLTESLKELNKRGKENVPPQQVQHFTSIPLKIVNSNLRGAVPPPPPIFQKLKSTNNTTQMVVEARKDIQKSLRFLGLTVKETSVSFELLLRYKLQNGHIQTSDIIDDFYNTFSAIFYQVLGVKNKKQAYEKFASKLGIENSGELIQKLTQNLDKELQSYFLESLTVETIDSILSSHFQIDALTKKINTKFADITISFLKGRFKEAFKKFNLELEFADKNFATVELFLKRKLSKTYLNYTDEEKLELVLGAFIRLLNKITQDLTFDFPKKISEKDKSQFMLNVETLKPTLVTVLNEAITEKFGGKRPFVKASKVVEEIKIDPSKTLPFLGGLCLTKAFGILPGENEEIKIRRLIDATPKQLSSLIGDVLKSLLSTSYTYKTAINTNATLVFTEPTIKIFNEVITERYMGFSAFLDGRYRGMITNSVDPFSLFSTLLKNQLGPEGNAPKEHTISMSSPHDRKKKIETKETINAFDILLSLPCLWQSKQKIEARKQRDAEEQQKKELATMHRVHAIRQFIQSEIEIRS